MVVPDSASAGYADEQEKLAMLRDSQGEALAFSLVPEPEAPPLPVCSQCVNWRAARVLQLADVTTQRTSGCCHVEAVADWPQRSEEEASICRLYEADIPF